MHSKVQGNSSWRQQLNDFTISNRSNWLNTRRARNVVKRAADVQTTLVYDKIAPTLSTLNYNAAITGVWFYVAELNNWIFINNFVLSALSPTPFLLYSVIFCSSLLCFWRSRATQTGLSHHLKGYTCSMMLLWAGITNMLNKIKGLCVWMCALSVKSVLS